MAATETTQTADTTTADTLADDQDRILNEIWDRDRADEPSGNAANATTDTTAGTAQDATQQTVQTGDRDQHGRFTKKDTPAPTIDTTGKAAPIAGADPSAAAAMGQQSDPNKPAAEAQSQTALQAPTDWSAEQKAQFDKVPAEGRPLVLDAYKNMQAGVTRQLQNIAGARKRYEVLDSAIAPIEAEAKKFNVSTDAAIRSIWQTHEKLLNPATRLQAIKQLAEDYEIDLAAAQNVQLPQRQPLPALPPEIDQRLSRVESEIQRGREQEQETALRTDAATAQTWGDEKAADGALVRPHLQTVLPEMTDMVGLVRKRKPSAPFAEVLQDAYEAACAANPAVRQKMVDDAAAARAKATISNDRTRGTRAAAASAVNVSRSGSSRVAPNSETDSDKIMNEIWERRHGTA